MVYIKDSLGVQGSGVTEAEIVSLLRDCVALATKKHGVLQPAREVIHFSSQFQPSYDLEKLFPGMYHLNKHFLASSVLYHDLKWVCICTLGNNNTQKEAIAPGP